MSDEVRGRSRQVAKVKVWAEISPSCEGVRGDLREGEEFIAIDGARVILIESSGQSRFM